MTGSLTGRGRSSRPAHVHLPVVEGAADDRVLPRLQHHVTTHKLLDGPLAVGQQTAQDQLVAAAERSAEHHDAEVQQVAVGRVRAPGDEAAGGGVRLRSGEVEGMMMGVRLPASLLEESELQGGALQHGEGRDGDRAAGFAGEAALETHFLPV